MIRTPIPVLTAITISLLATIAQAQSSARMPVSEIKPLLKRAIERGEAHGVLTGESAVYMKQKFGTAAALEIDVKQLHALPQSGCSRLQITTRQKHVQIKGMRGDQELVYQINYCREGGFPEKR